MVEYRNFRFSKLNTPEFQHLKYLVFWPIFGVLFLIVERLWIRDHYTQVHCALDDLIPFCEYFLIPYLFWFVLLIGMHLYALLFDTESFKKLMRFIIVSYSLAMMIYIVFPNCQELRPLVFERNNVFTRFLAGFYQFDTNTNVCPSIHVIGSVAVMVSAWNSRHFHTPGWRIIFGVVTILISMSTVFLKQHSAIDGLASITMAYCLYDVIYGTTYESSRRRAAEKVAES